MRMIGATHVGKLREANQDCFCCRQVNSRLLYAVVCDGMGGENGGQVASELALKTICAVLEQSIAEVAEQQSPKELLAQALAQANQAVYERALEDAALSGMGTTAVVLLLVDGMAHIAYVGDSRAYLYHTKSGVFTQLTRDHTVVQMLLDDGEITPQEMLTHPKRHYITRAVGVEPILEPSFREHFMEPEEILLLCSDGLYNYVEQSRLPALMQQALKDDSACNLIEAANLGGGGDNITAVVVATAQLEDR